MKREECPRHRYEPSHALLHAAVAGLLSVASVACSSEPSSPEGESGDPRITSSEQVANLSAEEFRTRCDERSGVVEDIPHCGGLNTCKGFSYDVTTQLLSEHTCKGAATCTGWNCVVD